MQVFVPYKNVIDIAKAMWADQRRYNKAIIELKQIIAAIEGAKAWRNHPVCLMYKEHEEWLDCYLRVFEAYRFYMRAEQYTFGKSAWANEIDFYNNKANQLTPHFIDESMQIQHRKRLYSKSPDKYPQFAEYGTSEINWYVVDGEIVKYINGKRIKDNENTTK